MVLSLATFGLFACSDGNGCGGSPEDPNNSDNPPQHETIGDPEDYFSFVGEVGEMLIGDTYYVTVDYNYKDGSEISYTSSNPDVASIDANGKIEAIKPGTTTIKGSWLGKEDTMDVTVVTNGLLPNLLFEYGVSTENVNFLASDTEEFDLNPYVLFNGKKFYDANLSYELDTTALGTMNGNKFISNGTAGVVNVTVTASWRGLASSELVKTLALKIIDTLEVNIDGVGDVIELDTVTDGEYVSTFDFTDKVSANFKGQSVNCELAVVDNVACPLNLSLTENVFTGEAVALNGNVLSALQEGTARLAITIHTGDQELGDVVLYRNIKVARPTKEISKPIEYFSMADGEILGLDKIIGTDGIITDAYQDGNLLKVTNNYVLGVISEETAGVGSEEITVCTSTYKYVLTLETYAKVLYDADDLLDLYVGASSATPKTGYYFLANDITYDSSSAPAPTSGNQFLGIFEGNGKTITGPVHKGLFGRLMGGSIVRNLSIKVDGFKSISNGKDYAILSSWTGGTASSKVVIENLYVSFDIDASFNYNFEAGKQAIGLINYRPAWLEFSNVFVDMTGIGAKLDDSLITGENHVKSLSVLFGTEPANLFNYDDSTCFIFNNTHVLWDSPYMGYYNANDLNNANYNQQVAFAENEDATFVENFAFPAVPSSNTLPVQTIKTVWQGLYRQSSIDKAIEYFKSNPEKLSAFSSFVDTSAGFPLPGGLEALVQNKTIVKVNGEEKADHTFDSSIGGSITVSMEFSGATIENITVEHKSGVEIVSIEGSTITYILGRAGNEQLSVKATISGVDVEKIINISATVEELTGEIMYSTKDNTAIIPSKYGTVTKLISKIDNVVYFEDGTYANVPQASLTATGEQIRNALADGSITDIIPTYDVLVFGEGGKLLGASKMTSYTKVLTEQSDFTEEFGATTTTDTQYDDYGYYILANDITFTTAHKNYNGDGQFNTFYGYFDGNEKNLNLWVEEMGIFGEIQNAVVTNVAMTVIKVSDNLRTLDDYYHSAIVLGGYTDTKTKNVYLENIYLRYDVDIDAGTVGDTTSTARNRSLYGFFGKQAQKTIWKNVILDATRITTTITSQTATLAAPLGGGSGTWDMRTVENVYVLQSSPYVEFFTTPGSGGRLVRAIFAENDTTAFETFKAGYLEKHGSIASNVKIEQKASVYRYDDAAALAAAGITEVGGFTIDSDGVSWTNQDIPVVDGVLVGEIMYSTIDNTAVIPKAYGKVTKIVSKLDESVVYYENGVYTNVPQYTSTATGVDIKTAKANGTLADIVPTYDVLVYGRNGVYLGESKMTSYTKVLADYDDFVETFGAPYDTDGTTLLNTDTKYDDYGYYIVANDITFSTGYSTRAADGKANTFYGYFDGNGKTLKVVLGSIGLFGELYKAVVTNASFIVTGTNGNNVANNANYSILLGGYTDGKTNAVYVENIYLKYAANIVSGYGSSHTNTKSEYGFFAKQAQGIRYKNVIVDLSEVNFGELGALNSNANWSAPLSGGSGTCDIREADGVYMIQSSKYIEYFSTKTKVLRVLFAKNDAEAMAEFIAARGTEATGNGTKTLADLTNHVCSSVGDKGVQNVYRYDDLAALVAAGVTTVGSFAISADGVTWAGNGN